MGQAVPESGACSIGDLDQGDMGTCLWSRWTAPVEPDLMSLAPITDEPPAEAAVAVAGHDRCNIPSRLEHVDAWLNTDPLNLSAQQAILDYWARSFHERRMAA